MAEEKKNNDTLCEGSKHSVTVEECTTDIVIVRLEFSGIVYRGALLNITNREAPCGVNVLRLQSNLWKSNPVTEVGRDKDKGVSNSATSKRFSYQTEPIPPLPEKVNTQKVTSRAYKEKVVRNIRLRPRQVLCAKCKTSCSDKPDSNKSSANTTEKNSPSKVTLPPLSIPLKISLKKPNLPESTSKINTRQSTKPVIEKISPIIKISFNNPLGHGTVVNIPRKIHNSDNDESDNDCDTNQSSASKSSVLMPRRVKKSIRKVKDRAQPYAPHSKHGKHKKHKHKHDKKLSHKLNPVVALSPLNLENLTNENFELPSGEDQTDHPYRSPLRTKVIMKRERSASGSMSYVYQAQRVGESAQLADDQCKKNLTINLKRMDETEDTVDCELDTNYDEENLGPLMMRVQTRFVNKVMLEDQRTISSGDIVWGKIHGFPWWPGRVESIKVGQKADGSIVYQQAHVSWFGSSTRSDIACADLYNFLDDFDSKFNKKKRGPYRIAIKEATRLARGLSSIAEDSESQKSVELPEPERVDVDTANLESVETKSELDIDVEGLDSERNSPLMEEFIEDIPPMEVLSPDIRSRSPPNLTPQTTAFSPLRMASPKYSPISMTSPRNSPPSSPLSTPKYSPIPMTSPAYNVGSPSYRSLPSPKYAPSTTSSFCPSTPKYPPVPMAAFHYSPAQMTSPYISPGQVTSPYYGQITSPYYNMAATMPSMAVRSPLQPQVNGSSPKPLARYSPKYSPVTPTPSPLHSPVVASPVQCV